MSTRRAGSIADNLGCAIGDIRWRVYEERRVLPDQPDNEFIGRVEDPWHVIGLSAGGPGCYSVVSGAMPGQVLVAWSSTDESPDCLGLPSAITRVPE